MYYIQKITRLILLYCKEIIFYLYFAVHLRIQLYLRYIISRGGSRTAATSKIERFVIIVNGWKPLTIITKQPLTIITKRSILDLAAVLDPPLISPLFKN